MTEWKLSHRLAALRRKKGVTQEELAGILGVTNQAVSKWESGACCPDIQLLPPLAAYYGVTMDDLMGVSSADTFDSAYAGLKGYLHKPPEETFSAVYRLALLLHEGACTDGYRDSVPWDTGRDIGKEPNRLPWGYSARCEPEGGTACRGGAVLFTHRQHDRPASADELHRLRVLLSGLSRVNTLPVLFALEALTASDGRRYATAAEIGEAASLPEEAVNDALHFLPVTSRPEGAPCYRLEGPAALLPPLLRMLCQPGIS